MPISVTCSCGRTYSKPDHNVGTSFRCHLCGQELRIERERVAPTLSRPNSATPPSAIENTARKARTRRRARAELTLSYNYPGLWLGAMFLAFLGATMLLPGLQMFLAPPKAPGAAPVKPAVFAALLIGGSVFLGLGALLGWLAYRMTERFDVDDLGIDWHNGGRRRARLPFRNIQYIQLQDNFGNLVIGGPPDTPELRISNGYKKFDELLDLLKESVDWEALVRSGPRGVASNPGQLSLARTRLQRLAPAADESVAARLVQHLQGGDCRAACVVSVEPLLVAAYTDELDCVAMLCFPPWLVREHGLEVGSRLVTVNTYQRGPQAASDLAAGRRHTGRYANFIPVIAEFVSDDRERIQQLEDKIPEKEWSRCRKLGDEYLNTFPDRWRDGSVLYPQEPAAGQEAKQEVLALPVVYKRRLPFWASVVGLVLLIALSTWVWNTPAPAAPQGGDGDARRQQEKSEARDNVLKFGLPVLCLLPLCGIFRCWTQFRLDEEGMEFRHFLRSRQYLWSELRSVRVGIRVVQTNEVKRYHHALVITSREGEEIAPKGIRYDPFLLRDTMVVAARQAGVTLRSE